MKPGNRLNSVLNPTAEMSADEVWFLVPPDLRNRAAFFDTYEKAALNTERRKRNEEIVYV